MSAGAYTASNDGSTKVEVTNTKTGYIYWHWMYSVAYASGTTRTISHRSGYWDQYGNSGKGNNYKYFYQIKSTKDCPYLDKYYCCSQSKAGYNCKSIIPSNANKTSSSGLGTDRFFRFEYYTSTYVKSIMHYYFYHDVSNASTEPFDHDNITITNKVKYVKWSNNL